MGEQTLTFQSAPSGQNWTASTGMRAEVLRAGDLLGEIYLDFCLSGLPEPVESSPTSLVDVKLWTPALGYAIIAQSKVIIGSQEFENTTGEYFMMHDEISRTEGCRASKLIGDYGSHLRGAALEGQDADGLSAIGSDEATLQAGLEFSTRSQKILAPLPHFWTGHAGNFLNVVGSQYHNIVIEMETRAYSQLALAYQVDRETGQMVPQSNASDSAPPADATQGVLSGMDILAVYIQLDTAERRLKAQAAQTVRFVYAQGAQYSTVATDAASTKEVSNFFNHPVTRMLWGWRGLDKVSGNRHEWFEFGAYRGARLRVGGGSGAAAYHRVQEVVPEINQFELLINNHSRVHQASEYFLYAQPYAHAKRVPSRVVYSYTFSMYPDAEDIHSGSINLSRIDNVVLRFTFKSVIAGPNPVAPTTTAAYLVAANSIAGLNTVQVDTGAAISPDNALSSAQVASGSLAGTIFFYAETINFYKQAAGMFGLLFA